MAVRVLGLLMVLLLASGTKAVLDAATCNSIVQDLIPCVPYFNDSQSEPTSACCQGAHLVASVATQTNDLKGICQCIKTAAINNGGFLDDNRANAIAGKCGVNVNIPPISRSTDCSTFQVINFCFLFIPTMLTAKVYENHKYMANENVFCCLFCCRSCGICRMENWNRNCICIACYNNNTVLCQVCDVANIYISNAMSPTTLKYMILNKLVV
ncbi:hypothetical protein AQUCO_01300105v1 [Aquilegia coerulea]|uniref:Bifunctional inhibitor/plant lipid transfer protein/seed storage helical domain-containing protein n=1 Tax=Aquilegia coerulea TaxID=218851 RepID=A0A2G5DZT9_AQUCA|nr:hypothetical protein AQUCO_01300105v1 [Aquilegia coerulea]